MMMMMMIKWLNDDDDDDDDYVEVEKHAIRINLEDSQLVLSKTHPVLIIRPEACYSMENQQKAFTRFIDQSSYGWAIKYGRTRTTYLKRGKINKDIIVTHSFIDF